jgi:hypothetical protein
MLVNEQLVNSPKKNPLSQVMKVIQMTDVQEILLWESLQKKKPSEPSKKSNGINRQH